MFTLKSKTESTSLELEIDALFLSLKDEPKDTEKYAATADQIVKLYKLKEVDNNSKKTVSADALVNLAGSLLGILAVINYERIHVVTTKALGFVSKIR
jgi:hypothetical protein